MQRPCRFALKQAVIFSLAILKCEKIHKQIENHSNCNSKIVNNILTYRRGLYQVVVPCSMFQLKIMERFNFHKEKPEKNYHIEHEVALMF